MTRRKWILVLIGFLIPMLIEGVPPVLMRRVTPPIKSKIAPSTAISRVTWRTEEGATVGDELVTNGDFSNGTNNWILGTGITISGGKANWSAVAGSKTLRQNITLSTDYYQAIFTVSDYYTDGAHVGAVNSQSWTEKSPNRYGPGTFRDIIRLTNETALFINGANYFTGSVSIVSLKHITNAVVDWNPRVVAITGDSIATNLATQYPDTYPGDTTWGHSLALANVTPLNYALGNKTFKWVATNGILSCAASGASTIIIHCGVNDINTSRTWSDVSTDLDSIRASVSGKDLFISEILPWSNGTDEQALTVRTWNTNLATWCSTNSATIIQCHDAMGQTRPSTGYLDDLYVPMSADGTHPSTGGNYYMWQIWCQALTNYYGVPVK